MLVTVLVKLMVLTNKLLSRDPVTKSVDLPTTINGNQLGYRYCYSAPAAAGRHSQSVHWKLNKHQLKNSAAGICPRLKSNSNHLCYFALRT
jgi:hypothetical protein